MVRIKRVRSENIVVDVIMILIVMKICPHLELSLPSVVSNSMLREWQKFDLLDLDNVIG